jgi:hypothetical protein
MALKEQIASKKEKEPDFTRIPYLCIAEFYRRYQAFTGL